MSTGIRQSTLRQRCSFAATAAEARFRIDRPVTSTEGARVIAVDDGAAAVVKRLTEAGWDDARFLQFVESEPVVDDGGPRSEVTLTTSDGAQRPLGSVLEGADAIVMVASSGDAAATASTIGEACFARGLMTAGLVVAPEADVDQTVTALRPNAMVLVILDDEDDLAEILTALRI